MPSPVKIIKQLLSFYESDTPGTKASLRRLLTHGRLGSTGRLIILPVDQGFEHGPGRSFGGNDEAFDPHYHYQMAIQAGLSAYAAPLGWLEAGAGTFAGMIPTILKMNSSNALYAKGNIPDQAITASVKDALRLGCTAIGFTIYPGSAAALNMFEEIRALAAEAKASGLGVVIWSYPRGNLSKAGEIALDVIAYGAHMAALLGAHIIKVKLPSSHIEMEESKTYYQLIPKENLADRVKHVVKSCFNGRRLVVFSGGETKDATEVIAEARAIMAGGGHGFIIGRNSFQRSREEAMHLLTQLVTVFRSGK